MSGAKKILVYADWEALGGPRLMGVLTATPVKGREVLAFEYEKGWLDSGFSQILDPNLVYFQGPQYLADGRANFGIFTDSSPDRWGRLLMKRRERALAKRDIRPERAFFESDYLIGVFDEQRMGGLRFKLSEGEPFLNHQQDFVVPPWASLRKLEHASKQLEDDDSVLDSDYLSWLQMLIAPGSSLGGARPKAGVVDTANRLWIAKFPSQHDNKDVGAWEKVAHELARLAGIRVPEVTVQRFSGRYHTFLSRRFDRVPNGGRLHFASAMTLLGHSDGHDHSMGASYLELVDFLMRHGAQTDTDLVELWRRIVFNIAISNTDDHLRNHGFILGHEGWILSPAYDMNPVEYDTGGLRLNINEVENALEFSLALEVAELFRLSPVGARAVLDEVCAAAGKWRKIATQHGIPRSEMEMMESAFRC